MPVYLVAAERILVKDPVAYDETKNQLRRAREGEPYLFLSDRTYATGSLVHVIAVSTELKLAMERYLSASQRRAVTVGRLRELLEHVPRDAVIQIAGVQLEPVNEANVWYDDVRRAISLDTGEAFHTEIATGEWKRLNEWK